MTLVDLTSVATSDQHPADLVLRHTRILRTFDRTQDSGNVSWLVEADGSRLFVKTAGRDEPPAPGAPVPYFGHTSRVELLRNAITVARSCDHPALATLVNVVESPDGPMLVYAAAVGENVHVPREQRSDPASAYQRFAHLPAERLLGVFDTLIDLHRALAKAGWVGVDLYDGCLLVDLDTGGLTVVDLDTYRRGPSVNEMGRMFGSSTFMAPEEFELGAPIDQRTTVFTLGRLVWHFGTRLTERAEVFCGPPALAGLGQQACDPDRARRPATVAAFANAWRAAATLRADTPSS